ncbi:MAG TPA: hypothetical protein VGL91_13155 [Acidobacteriota bacterium]
MALDSVVLNIGDLPTSFLFSQLGAPDELARHYRNFLIESPKPEAVKKSEPRPLGSGPSDPALRGPLANAHGTEFFHALSPLWHFQVSTAPEMVPPEGLTSHDVRIEFEGRELKLFRADFEANIDLATCHGTLRYTGLIPSFENFLRALYSVRLLGVEGLLVHACSIEYEGAAHLFAGTSGAGKSTIARLSGARILTDEISVVRRDGDQFYLYGTPFWGELRGGGELVRFPLRTVNFLHKDDATFAKSVGLAEGIRKLLRCTLFFSTHLEWRHQLLMIAEAICALHRCQDLHFQQGKEFLRLLDAGQAIKN